MDKPIQKMGRRLTLAALLLFLFGCAQNPPSAERDALPSASASAAAAGASIRGTLQRKFDETLVTCAERPVLLIAGQDADPILKLMEREQRLPTASELGAMSRQETRSTQCDKNGSFVFQKLPASRWLLVAEVFDGTATSGIVQFVDTTADKETTVDFEWEDAPQE